MQRKNPKEKWQKNNSKQKTKQKVQIFKKTSVSLKFQNPFLIKYIKMYIAEKKTMANYIHRGARTEYRRYRATIKRGGSAAKCTVHSHASSGCSVNRKQSNQKLI